MSHYSTESMLAEKIDMRLLKESIERANMSNVVTYINSVNMISPYSLNI